MRYKFKNTGAGINKDAPAFELAEGEWSDAVNARFRNRVAKKRGTFRGVYSNAYEMPYFLASYVTPTDRLMLAAGLTRVYSHNGDTATNITRYGDGKGIVSLTRSGTTATLTTDTAHGLTTGETVSVFNALVGGSSDTPYNGTFSVTVTGGTTFTYTMTSDPGASATVSSAGYSHNLDLFGGAILNEFTGIDEDKWTGGSFNGIAVLNNPVDGPYYWAGDTSVRLRRLPGWPLGQKADAMFFYKNYIFALAPTINGVKNEQLFIWGSAAEPGALPATWTAASTNDAGDSPLPAETGGALIDGATLGDMAYVFDADACYGVQYIGGNDVFRVFRLPGVEGLLARGCIARVPESPNGGGPGLVYLSNGDVRFLTGASSYSIADGRVKDYLNSVIASGNQRCFVAAHPMYSEVWIYFPQNSESACDKAAVWNYHDDTWALYDFGVIGYTCATTGLIANGLTDETIDSDTGGIDSDGSTIDQTSLSSGQLQMLVATGDVSANKIGVADAGGTLDFDVAYGTVTMSLERRGIDLGDAEILKLIHASRWHFEGPAGSTATIYHGAASTADGEPTYLTYSGTHTQGTTNWVNKFGPTGRFLMLRIETTSPIALRSYELDVASVGQF